MTLDEAYKITSTMTSSDKRKDVDKKEGKKTIRHVLTKQVGNHSEYRQIEES